MHDIEPIIEILAEGRRIGVGAVWNGTPARSHRNHTEITEVRVAWGHSAGLNGKGCGKDGSDSGGRRSDIRLGVEGIRLL